MKHTILTLLVGAFVATFACVGSRDPDLSWPPPAPVAPAVSAAAEEPTPAPIPSLELAQDPDRGDPYFERLEAYLVRDILENWPHAAKEVPTVPLADVAHDVVAAVVHEPDDGGHCPTVKGSDGRTRCLWGVPGWNSDHAKAVLLAAVGYWEGARYAASVDDGRCNDAQWRADPANARLLHLTGNCDGGRAHSLWQIWPRKGEARVSPLNVACDENAVAERHLAARCALMILRMSMMMNEDLTGYTGESTWGGKTKATLRLRFAENALKKHPF